MAKKDGHIVLKLLDVILLVLTLALSFGLLVAYISPYVNPNAWWPVAYFGLAAPLLFLANLLLALYWACRWSPFFFLPVIVILIGIGNLSKFYRFPIGRSYREAAGPDGLKVMTFNVEGFIEVDEETRKAYSTAEDIVGFIKEEDPDIVCIQEFQSTPKYPQEKIDEWLSDWPYRTMGYTVNRTGKGIWGTALYSKYPLVETEHIRFPESNNAVLTAGAVFGADTIRIFCCHLETTYVDRNNLEFLNYYSFLQEEDRTGHIRVIGGRLLKGFTRRAAQADSLSLRIAEITQPVIVCGDFNDTPMSYTYRKVKGNLKDSFSEKGDGYGYSYKKLGNILRIDYAFHSGDFDVLRYESPQLPWSDHKPLIVTLRLKNDPEPE